MRRPPLLLLIPALLTAAAVLVPLLWLVLRAADTQDLDVWAFLARPRTLSLLGNTAVLAVTVLAACTVIGVPLAWLVTRTTLKGRRIATLLAVLPLAVPGYVMAYALRGLGGPMGAANALFGVTLPRLDGFTGAALALTLYNTPYMFLTLKVAFERLDPAQGEAARTLGASPWQVLRRVVLPTLLPAWMAGALLIGLYVLGDFGVVSLMRFDTLSLALYTNWTDVGYAAWLALMLVATAGVLLSLEIWIMRGRRQARVGVGAARIQRRVALGRWQGVAWCGIGLFCAFGVIAPVGSSIWWYQSGPEMFTIDELWTAAIDSLSIALPAAALTVLLALPLAWLTARSVGLIARIAERVAQVGYAIPSLALALALVFFSIRVMPGLRDGLWLVIIAFALHFLMLALGPIRGTLALLTPAHEEAARTLGASPIRSFVRVTLPALRGSLTAGFILAFLAAMKELPLTMILAPVGTRPLSVSAWSYADEALFADAAPFALTIVALSALTVGFALRGGER